MRGFSCCIPVDNGWNFLYGTGCCWKYGQFPESPVWFSGPGGVRFLCRDITRDPLPDAELCVIRQVLQHLSNREIEKILDQVRKYPYVLITEHVVRKRSAKQYNRDKVHGGQTRVVSGSGVYLDEAPFNLEIKTVLKIPYSGMGRKNEEMVTVLLKNE